MDNVRPETSNEAAERRQGEGVPVRRSGAAHLHGLHAGSGLLCQRRGVLCAPSVVIRGNCQDMLKSIDVTDEVKHMTFDSPSKRLGDVEHDR